MSSTKLECVTHNPKLPAKACVIWLHGLGADGYDFAPIVPELNLPDELAVRFIFPHAPIRPVTLNSGMEMRAWFDLYGLTFEVQQDENGIRAAEQMLHELITQEIASGILPEKIVLAGFSQGGALALHSGLRYPKKLAGIMGLSTVLPLSDKIQTERLAANHDIPILLAHGTMDMVIPFSMGLFTKTALEQAGYKPEWHPYKMAHSVCPEEIRDISHWLQKVL